MSMKLSCLLAVVLAALAVAGCKGEKKKAEPSRPAGPPAPPVAPVAPQPPAIRGVDHLDSTAAQVQGLLPRSGQVGQWAKVAPVTFYPAANLSQIGDVEYFAPYGVDWAADAMYQLGGDAGQRLVVQLFHCRDSGDAYGLMSVASDQPAGLEARFGQETRGEGERLEIWTGNFYLHLWSQQQQGLTFMQAMRQLARDIVAALPADGRAPPLVQILNLQRLQPGQMHYFRGPASLASRGLTALVHEQALASVLALDSDDQLVLAAYDVPAARSPCFIFIACYGTAQRAAAAHARLLQRQADAETALGLGLVVGELIGPYVFGTVTGEEYSLLERSATPTTEDSLPVFPTIARRLRAGL